MVVRAQQSNSARAVLRAGDVYVADGIGLRWAAGVLGLSGIERYPGIDLAEDLLARLALEQGSVYLLGAKPGVAEVAADRLCSRFAGLKLAGVHDGYFPNSAASAIVSTISAGQADVLLVGMGSPAQEAFIANNRDKLGVPLMVGIGGALEVWAGVKRRAPAWVQRSGFEWAYRAAADISRLTRLGVLPRFIALVLSANSRRAR
jgi:N-acetylglucosaminyldiphosphoundecaprenol N-acetyl-beta-D-mannosaminyltransferase